MRRLMSSTGTRRCSARSLTCRVAARGLGASIINVTDRILVEPRPIDGGISAAVHYGGEEPKVLWILSDAIDDGSPDDLTPWMMTLLPYAMRRALPLHLAGAVDELVLHNLDAIQHQLHAWFPRRLTIVDVVPDRVVRGAPRGGHGAFFSGGVDSFYTLAEANPPLDAIILICGFDFYTEQTAVMAGAIRTTEAAAKEFGVDALAVKTNMRSLTNWATDWGFEQHGASLAAVAYALRERVGTVHIASSFSDADLHPWGSHPDLDPLWSSSVQTIVHDSTKELRVEKVDRIMEFESARAGLRVCWGQTETVNCGICEKCVRTRINLLVVGHDGVCATLPPLRVEDVRAMPLVEEGAWLFARENLSYLRSHGLRGSVLDHALTVALRRGMAKRVVGRIPGTRRSYHALRRWLSASGRSARGV